MDAGRRCPEHDVTLSLLARLVVAFVAALLLAGCGADSSSEPRLTGGYAPAGRLMANELSTPGAME